MNVLKDTIQTILLKEVRIDHETINVHCFPGKKNLMQTHGHQAILIKLLNIKDKEFFCHLSGLKRKKQTDFKSFNSSI